MQCMTTLPEKPPKKALESNNKTITFKNMCPSWCQTDDIKKHLLKPVQFQMALTHQQDLQFQQAEGVSAVLHRHESVAEVPVVCHADLDPTAYKY